jgi:hypothetical protein
MCRPWTNSDDHETRAGATASPVYAAVFRQEDYRLHWGDVRENRDVLLGVAVSGIEPPQQG